MKDILLMSFFISIIFVAIILNLIHKKRLKEQYSLLWLFFGFIMILLSLSAKWLDIIANLLEIKYPPALIFLIGILICLVLILHITVVASKQTERIVRLTQEVGILRHEIKNIKN